MAVCSRDTAISRHVCPGKSLSYGFSSSSCSNALACRVAIDTVSDRWWGETN